MAKFRNRKGVLIETNDPATVNNYRNREGFEEVKSAKQSTAKKPIETKKTDNDES